MAISEALALAPLVFAIGYVVELIRETSREDSW